ncbi:M23 family metallopeptidase [Geodermatophilus sp. URMC 64]
MSSLDHDHLLDEAPEPRTRTGSTLAPAGGTRSRRRPAARAGEKALESTPEPRQRQARSTRGTTTPRRTGGRGSAETAPARATAKATVTRAAGAARSAAAATRTAGTKVAETAKPAAAKAAKVATVTAATAKPAVAKAVKAATVKAAPGKTTKPATAKPATAKAKPARTAAPKTAAPKAATAKTTPAKTTPAKAARTKSATPEPAATPAAEAPAPRPRPRPTPRPRPAAAEPAPEVLVVAAAEPVRDLADAASLVAVEEARSRAVVEQLSEAPADVVVVTEIAPSTGSAPGRWSRLRRRPAMYLAAAVIGAIAIGAVSAGSAAQADPVEQPSHSMSVAAELGISSQQTTLAPDAQDADRLAELAASRATREAEQDAAVAAQQEADRVAAAAIAEAARPKAVLPVDGARLTSGFGSRWGTLHAGIDLAAPIGTPEYAAMDGVVLEAGPASGYGLAVYIQHENGDVTVYGHMEQILVVPGQVVKAGDTIALLGNRGQSTGPHLHFEVHVGGLDGAKVDPIPWLRDRGVRI